MLGQFDPAATVAEARSGSGAPVARAMVVRGVRLVNVQEAKLKPRIEPRNVLASVWTRLKQGSHGRPFNEAQTASLLTFNVPAGSIA